MIRRSEQKFKKNRDKEGSKQFEKQKHHDKSFYRLAKEERKMSMSHKDEDLKAKIRELEEKIARDEGEKT
jgi:hypothetical protein